MKPAYEWFGWLCCEAAFRGWYWLGDRGEGGIFDRIFSELYRIGCTAYGRAG